MVTRPRPFTCHLKWHKKPLQAYPSRLGISAGFYKETKKAYEPGFQLLATTIHAICTRTHTHHIIHLVRATTLHLPDSSSSPGASLLFSTRIRLENIPGSYCTPALAPRLRTAARKASPRPESCCWEARLRQSQRLTEPSNTSFLGEVGGLYGILVQVYRACLGCTGLLSRCQYWQNLLRL